MSSQSNGPDGDQVLSITDVTTLVKDILRDALPNLWVCGEISDLARPQSGHIYMTLKDDQSQIKAVIWRNVAQRIRFPLEDGLEILCRGEIDVYPPRGTYQLVIRELQPRGQGALQARLQQLQRKLAAEGLFAAEHKQPLPMFPRRVALVTSPTGAALRDFLQVAARRWDGVELLVIPTRVQGDGAAAEIAQAIRTANRLRPRMDVVVVTRGGGSMEDLWCFNEEPVVRAIFESSIPTVSAVGHEIDVTLSDLVADVRALTPSEAAERVIPSRDEITHRLGQLAQRLAISLHANAHRARMRIDALANRPVLKRPWERLHELSRRVDELAQRSTLAVRNCQRQQRQQLLAIANRLESLSPLAVLGRGYSVTLDRQGTLIRSATDVKIDDLLQTQLRHGKVISRVSQIDADAPD